MTIASAIPFAETALLTAALIADRGESAFPSAPAGLSIPDGIGQMAAALLFELNRFPGSTIFTHVPEGPGREDIIRHVEDRAYLYDDTAQRNVAQRPGYHSVGIYVRNLRDLFLTTDIDTGRYAVPAAPGDIEKELAALKAPAYAIEFALAHLESFEMADFFQDWRAGRCLRGWLEGIAEDRGTAAHEHAVIA